MSSDYTDDDWSLGWKRCNKGRCIHNVVTKEKMDTCMGQNLTHLGKLQAIFVTI